MGIHQNATVRPRLPVSVLVSGGLHPIANGGRPERTITLESVRSGGPPAEGGWSRWRLKEPFCGTSHLAGALLSVAALFVLVRAAAGRPLHMTGFALFGASLVLLYSASSLYHSLRLGPGQTARLQRFDFIAIFLLIAGTFAPLCLVTLRGAWGWGLLSLEYALAFTGIAAVVTLRDRFPAWLRMTMYLVMGWLVVAVSGPLGNALPPAGVAWLVAGGLTYTLGAVVLATDRPHLWPGRFSAHDLWHVFVLAGSACHFVLMLRYVAPAA